MNRKAKRNKYKKLQRELERKIAFFDSRRAIEGCFSTELKTQTLSCFKPIEEYSRLPPNVIKEYYEKEVSKQIAEEILKHKEFYKVTDTGFGYRYDLTIVKFE